MRIELYDPVGGRCLGHAAYEPGEYDPDRRPNSPWPGDKIDGIAVQQKRSWAEKGTYWWHFTLGTPWTDASGKEHTIVWTKDSLH
jgi:hypothetical protein